MSKVVAALIATTAIARADNASDAAKLFEQGRQQIEANQVDAACATFDQSLALDPQIGTRLNLADCREHQGKLDVAYTLFRQVVDEGVRTGKEGRAGYAKQHVAALEKKIARVTVHIDAPTPGLALAIGGVTVAPDTQVAVMPGAIAVIASAPKFVTQTVTADGVAGAEATISIPALAAEVVVAPLPPPIEHPEPQHAKPKLAYIVGGAGVGLVAVSLGVGLLARSHYNTAYADKDASGVTSAQHQADIATVVGVVGLVAVGAGVVLYLRRGDDAIAVAPTGTGLALLGSF